MKVYFLQVIYFLCNLALFVFFLFANHGYKALKKGNEYTAKAWMHWWHNVCRRLNQNHTSILWLHPGKEGINNTLQDKLFFLTFPLSNFLLNSFKQHVEYFFWHSKTGIRHWELMCMMTCNNRQGKIPIFTLRKEKLLSLSLKIQSTNSQPDARFALSKDTGYFKMYSFYWLCDTVININSESTWSLGTLIKLSAWCISCSSQL